MKEEITQLKNTALRKIEAAPLEVAEVDLAFKKYLGRKGALTLALRKIKDLSEEERKEMGVFLNSVKKEIEEATQIKKDLILKKEGEKKERGKIDITRPAKKYKKGLVHPLTKIGWEIEDIFSSLGFSVAEGPQVETEYYNFEALNIPREHPARDLWDTFWIKPRSLGLLLRTHTSPVQARYMEKNKPPLRIISPGRVFRYEATDASHHFQFNQVEGLMVGEDISVANFRAVIASFFSAFFESDVKLRLRPGFFPFVEPGFEVDINCVNCSGSGCPTCSKTGWLEMSGAGMVHPSVFRAVGYDPDKVSGFAFGIGLDRLALMKYKIDDVRLFQEGDIRFLRQFI